MANISITATGGPSPDSLDTTPGSKINWTNNNSSTVNSFTLPTCVSPQTSPAPIAPGTTTRDYTVNNGTHGDYDYSYTVDDIDGTPQDGIIDVG
jgi:hypothetical protein